MANKFLIKGSNTSSEVPSSLTQGSDDGNNDAATEIAINRADGKLYYLNNSDSVTAGELSDTTYAAGAGITIAGGGNTITVSSDSLTEAMLDVSNGPTNGYALTAQSGAGGGLTWADLSSGGVPSAITVADESSDATCFIMFGTAATGDLEPKTGSNLTFNSSTGVLTASGLRGGLVGDVTGNVTGNTSGSSATCSGLAASATVLATARTIAGVSFNGSANISLNNNAISNGAGYTTNAGTTTASNTQTFTNKTWNGTAIASGYIAGDAITGAKIADNAIDSEHYTDGSIDNAHIADNAINSEHYADGSIDNAHIADNAINSEHYAADSIDAEHYAAGSVDATALGADCVTAAKIGDNVINSEHYAAGSIDNEHIADDAVNSEHYAAGSIDQAHLADQVVNEAKMQISNGPTNGYALTAQSGNTGGLTWADISSGGVPTNITLADESNDTTCFVMFATESTGDQEPKTGTNLIFNSNTGVLEAGGFRGDLVGNVTGNTSGSAGSVSGNAGTATILATARTIAGVSFNGSANISLNNNAITNGAGYTTATGDITGVTAGTGLSGGGTSGGVTLNVDAAQTQITSVGTIGTGTWQGTAIASGYIADNSITLAKMASGTDGNIISFDASGNPVAVATGSDGQVLTSTGAGSPPAFEDAAGGGGGAAVGTGPANDRIAIWEDSSGIGGQANATIDSSGNAAFGGTVSDSTGQVMSGLILDQGAAVHGLANSNLQSGNLTLSYAAGPSDERLKTGITTLEYGLDEIKAISPKWFKYNETNYNSSGLTLPIPTTSEHKDAYYNEQHSGLMAADVKAVMPKLVSLMEDDKDYETYDKDALIFVLVNAVKELEARVATLEG